MPLPKTWASTKAPCSGGSKNWGSSYNCNHHPQSRPDFATPVPAIAKIFQKNRRFWISTHTHYPESRGLVFFFCKIGKMAAHALHNFFSGLKQHTNPVCGGIL
jgi:hypothetical protein